MTKRLLIVFLWVLSAAPLFSQFVVTPNSNGAQLIANLQGQGVTISNPLVLCHQCGIGTFNGGNATNLGLNQGVVMSTGAIANNCPAGQINSGVANPATTSASYSAGGPADALVNLISPSTLGSFDRCRLEFDITPTGDSVKFDYVFGSEEYTSFVCTNYNDAFGFFVTGPNPGGGNYANQNVALVPGTNQPVLIGTINDGTPNGAVQPCLTNNTQYYVNNTGTSIVFDGFTTVLTARFATVPCQTYRVILVIGDVGDGVLDSGVFLEAKSFSSTTISISASTQLGNTFQNAVEGCVNGQFRFRINPALPTNFTINYTVAGTATNGVDYTNIGNSVVVPAGDTVVTIPVNVANDGIAEGLETVKLLLINPCTNQPYDSATLTIQDSIIADATATDYFICRGETTTLNATGGVTYQWTPAASLATPNAATTVASPDTTTRYTVTANVNGCSATDTLTINVSDPNFTVDAGPNDTICANEIVQFVPVVTQGAQPYTYLWTPSTYITAGQTTVANATATPLQSTTYTLTVNSANGCTLTDSVRIVVAGVGPPVDATASPTLICPGQQVQLNYTSQPNSCGINTVGCFGIDEVDSVCANCLTQTGSPTTNVTVYGNYFQSRRLQLLYTAAELNAALGGGGTIRELAWRVGTYNQNNQAHQNFTIRMKCVPPTQTQLTNWETGLTTVYGPKTFIPINGPGWNVHPLDNLYDWDGVSNVVIEICFFTPNSFGNLNGMMQYSNVPGSVLYSQGNTNQCNVNNAPLASSQRPKMRVRICQPNYNNMTVQWTPASGPNAVSNATLKNPTANPQTTQTYQVTVSQNGCSGSDFVTVNIDTSVKVNAGADQSFCVGQNVTLTAQPSGTPLPGNTFVYEWRTLPANSLVGGTQTITVNPSSTTTYVVRMTGGPCPVFDTVVISVGSLLVNETITPITCNGAANGKIKINSTGTAPFTYNWSANANTANVDSAVNLAPGTYLITVTDALNCVGRDTFVLTQPTAITFTSTTQNVSCAGGSNGSITLNATGGTGALSFAWSNSAPDNAVNSNLVAGAYQVTITDVNACSTTGTFTITEPTALAISNTQTKNVRCFGGNDGFIIITPGGGTTPYSYQWSHNGTLNQPNATSLAANTYNVTLTDANQCSVSTSVVIFQPQAGITFNPSSVANATCFGAADGQATVNPTGGSAPYTYLWSPGNQTTQTATGLSANTYTVVVTDDSLCTATATVNITQPAQIQITGIVSNVLCNGNSDGGIDITVTNGVSPFVYNWSNNVNTEDNPGIPDGAYNVTVTDSTSCTQTASFTVTEPPLLVLNNPTITNVSCFGGNNGTIIANPAGGTGNYSFAWSPVGGNSATNASLTAGAYNITVTDANSCSATATYSVTEPAAPLAWGAPVITDVLCNGLSTGAITVSLSGGTPNYTYIWSGNAGNAATVSNLLAGTYTVTATDANSCTITASHTISQPSAITFGASQVNDASCFGTSDGSAEVFPGGGVGNFTYSWNGVAGPNPINGLPAATYTVVVTDGNNCTAATSITINQPVALLVNPVAQDATCFGAFNGSIDANPSGGVTPYSFVWTGGSTTQVATELYAGVYFVTVTDANGCSVTGAASINEPTELFFNVVTTPVKCVGDKNGTITINAQGATPPYNYSATQDGANFFFATGNVIVDLAPGFYLVIVADNNGCTKTDTAYVPDAVADVYTLSTDSTSCYGPLYNDGAIFVAGLTFQNMPYQYSVDGSPLQFSGDFYGMSAGPHEVKGVNNFGCETILTAIVPEPAEGIAEVYPGDTTLQLGQSLQLGSGFSPYPLSSIVSYNWFPSEGLSCSDCASPVLTSFNRMTEYTLTITYNEICTAKASLKVIVENNLPLYIPNAFSPNGDGNNDMFMIYGEGIKTVDLQIYNRWGELIYQSNNQFSGWDGTYKGVLQNPGVYTYYVIVTYLDNKEVERKGTITILR